MKVGVWCGWGNGNGMRKWAWDGEGRSFRGVENGGWGIGGASEVCAWGGEGRWGGGR